MRLPQRPQPRTARSGLEASAPPLPPMPPPPGAMAAAAGDGAAKPLQSAMKLANKAIELDTGNRPRVRLGGVRQHLARGGRGRACEGTRVSNARGGSGTPP